MLSISEKKEYRSELFRHLDGIAVAPVAFALKEKGVLDFILKKKELTLNDIVRAFPSNDGYLNVGIRMLASQGWLTHEISPASNTITIGLNKRSEIAFQQIEKFADVVGFMKNSEAFHPRHFDLEQFTLLSRIFNKYKSGAYDPQSDDDLTHEIESQIVKQIEGVLVGPITVFLGMDGMFHKYFMEASFSADEFHEDPVSFSKILDFFCHLGWFSKKK